MLQLKCVENIKATESSKNVGFQGAWGRGSASCYHFQTRNHSLWSGLLQVLFVPRFSYSNTVFSLPELVRPSLSMGILYYLCKRWRLSPAAFGRQSQSGLGRGMSSSVTPWEYSYCISRVMSRPAAVQPLDCRGKLLV